VGNLDLFHLRAIDGMGTKIAGKRRHTKAVLVATFLPLFAPS
jgi:hypothetical protein